MTTGRKELLARFIRQVWDDGDAEAAGDYLAPAYTIHHDPGDPWEGRTLDLQGFRERLVQSRAAFPDQRFDVQGMFADGDGVVMTWLWEATHAGDIPGYPATGHRIRMSGATLYLFDAEDRLTGHWQIADRLGVFQQLQRNVAAG
ncbi:ester cyclase [Sandaracinobacteroides hominis]|uniref:ester cyclase n=1 Tax=Sandaracinobacteroides hominis TaxID=2780086 RepID=UPI0018F5F5BA|nr:ester cyclase [Sandaracinobacteroides hominis]